jgi:lysophospholipase L1-like esterase
MSPPAVVVPIVGVLATAVVGCASQSVRDTTTDKQPIAAMMEEQRFLALGDSYTIGESVTPEERWPVQLVTLLRSYGVRMEDPTIIAKTGWTTDELSSAIDQQNPRGTFDLVSLLIGVNNQYRGRSPDKYRVQFKQLLERAIRLAGMRASRVVVLSIPDWGVTPFAEGRNRKKIAGEIDLFNRINREESADAGVHYVDVTPASREATHKPSLIAPDGLHPSGEMYAEWAELVRQEIQLLFEVSK